MLREPYYVVVIVLRKKERAKIQEMMAMPRSRKPILSNVDLFIDESPVSAFHRDQISILTFDYVALAICQKVTRDTGNDSLHMANFGFFTSVAGELATGVQFRLGDNQ